MLWVRLRAAAKRRAMVSASYDSCDWLVSTAAAVASAGAVAADSAPDANRGFRAKSSGWGTFVLSWGSCGRLLSPST